MHKCRHDVRYRVYDSTASISGTHMAESYKTWFYSCKPPPIPHRPPGKSAVNSSTVLSAWQFYETTTCYSIEFVCVLPVIWMHNLQVVSVQQNVSSQKSLDVFRPNLVSQVYTKTCKANLILVLIGHI
jgi:hypothetical protein